MSTSFRDLFESQAIDRLFYWSINLFFFLPLIDLWSVSEIWIPILYLCFYLRSQISYWSLRKLLTGIMIVGANWSGAWNSLFYFTSMELIRYGIPYLIAEGQIKYRQNRSPTIETCFKRLIEVTSGPSQQVMLNLYKIITEYQQGNESNPLTDEELTQLFDLDNTHFYYDEELIIFNPFFIYRWNGLYFSKYYNIRRSPNRADKCSICKKSFPEVTLYLGCSHEYCPRCILGKKKCPQCLNW